MNKKAEAFGHPCERKAHLPEGQHRSGQSHQQIEPGKNWKKKKNAQPFRSSTANG
jgi:hypothetical protein